METGPVDPKHSDVARGGNAPARRAARLVHRRRRNRGPRRAPHLGRPHDRHRCHILDLVSPTPGRIVSGPAVTISYFPSCSAALDPEQHNLANLFYEAVGDDPAGKVIVLAANGCTDPVTPCQANVPVVLDRLAVMPGHYVFADSSAAVVIPDVPIQEALAEARKLEARDAAVGDQIAREQIRASQSRPGKEIIMSSASDGMPIPAAPERNIGGIATP